MLAILFLFLSVVWPAFPQEIGLSPADPASLGAWAQVAQAVRLHPTPQGTLKYTGPDLSSRLFGEIALGKARYSFLLGVTPENEVGLWLDQDANESITAGERVPGSSLSGAVLWTVSLTAAPAGGSPFSYPLQILWPVGRSYVFLVGGAPRAGTLGDRTVVLVDGDLDGVFGTAGDFLGVDVDGDGQIYADPDGHERFKITEAFTIENRSFRVGKVSPDGTSLTLEITDYVPPKVPLIPGAPAPDFSFRNFLDGKELRLSQLRGKVVLLDFWATWCPPCMASLPEVLEIYEEFHPQGFEIVGVSLDESAADLRKILESYGVSWPIAFFGKRWENPVADLYRVYQIPTTYLLDKNGVIRFRDLEGEELRRAIQELLAEPFGAEENASSVLSVVFPSQISLPSKGVAQIPLALFNEGHTPLEEVTIRWEGLPPGVRGEPAAPFSLASGEGREVSLSLYTEGLELRSFPAFAALVIAYRTSESPVPKTEEFQIELVLEQLVDENVVPFGGWMWGFLALGLALVLILFLASS